MADLRILFSYFSVPLMLLTSICLLQRSLEDSFLNQGNALILWWSSNFRGFVPVPELQIAVIWLSWETESFRLWAYHTGSAGWNSSLGNTPLLNFALWLSAVALLLNLLSWHPILCTQPRNISLPWGREDAVMAPHSQARHWWCLFLNHAALRGSQGFFFN